VTENSLLFVSLKVPSSIKKEFSIWNRVKDLIFKIQKQCSCLKTFLRAFDVTKSIFLNFEKTGNKKFFLQSRGIEQGLHV